MCRRELWSFVLFQSRPLPDVSPAMLRMPATGIAGETSRRAYKTKGSTPSIIPTMLRGSAPSPGSGAPYRTGSEIRPTIWPPPAHQNELISRNHGIYSLFPGPNDNAKTLYTPTAKAAHSGSAFQNFLASPKVPDSFFSAKFPSFGANGSPPFNTSETGIGISRVDSLMSSKTSDHDPKSYASPEKEGKDECAIRNDNLKHKRGSSDEIVVIKNEINEVNKSREKDDEQSNDSRGRRKEFDRENQGITPGISYDSESTNVPAEGGLSNEPDSTECKIPDEVKSSSEMCSSESERSEKNCSESGNEIEEITTFRNTEKTSDLDGDNVISKEKCNINVIDLSVNDVGKSNNEKPEKCLVKVESVNDICNRLTEKKYVRSKTPDSSCKSLTVNCKHTSNEPSKPSPNRTLSLPSNKGGCSRTTPVTFKHLSQQEVDSKSQSLNVEVPSVVIKKEPVDFQKYPNGAPPPFLSLTPLDNLFNPNNLRVLHAPLLSPIPYRDSYESSTRLQESFLSPGGMTSNFLSPSSSFLNSRPVSESPFLSPKLDLNDFGTYKNYRNLPGNNQSTYLLNGEQPKMTEGLFSGRQSCLSAEDGRGGQENSGFVNSTTSDSETKNVSPSGSGSNSVNATPCQVAEVTSASSSLLSPKIPLVNPMTIKQEAASASSGSASSSSTSQKKEVIFMPSGQSAAISSTVGGALTRHRCQQRPNEIKMSSSVLPPPGVHRTIQSPAPFNLPSAMGAAVYTGGLSCEERSTAIWPAQTHNPTIWQYSAPIDYPPFPPVGFQLVRDPITGHFLLIPSSNIEALQRAVLWPSYQPAPHQMIIPPISVQPNPPSLLLDTNVSAVDFLTPESINRTTPQHRLLITADNASAKRKIPPPAVIKLESSDCASAIVVTSYENNTFNTKSQSTSASQGENVVCFSQRSSEVIETLKSQVTSPAPCLPPIYENSSDPSNSSNAPHILGQPTKDQTITVTLQDACNQTDLLPFAENEESQSLSVCRDRYEPYIKVTEQNNSLPKTQDMGTDMTFPKELPDDKEMVKQETRKIVDKNLNIQILDVPGVNIKKEIISPTQVDLSGLELLSNSIEQLMHDKNDVGTAEKGEEDDAVEGEKKDLSNDACEGAVLLQNLKNGFREVEKINSFKGESSKSFDGLGILCALVEQRFQEEIGEEMDEEEEEEKPKLNEEAKEEEEERGSEICDNAIIQSCHKEIKDCDLNRNYQGNTIHLNKIKVENIVSEDVMEEMSEPLKTNKKMLSKEQEMEKEDDINETNQQPQIRAVKRGPGRPKKSTGKISEIKSTTPPSVDPKENEKSKEMSPPVLEKETDYLYKDEKSSDSMGSLELNSQADILNPPKLTPSAILDPVCKPKTENVQVFSCKARSEPGKPGQDCEASKRSDRDSDESSLRKRKSSDDENQHSSSKKRKVGRPKKSLSSQNPLTETIVAKIPKTKSNYLFQGGDPVCESSKKFNSKIFENNSKRKNPFVKLTTDLIPLPNCGSLESDLKKNNKIRPKLKAEAKVKEWTSQVDDEQVEWKKNVQKEEMCKQKLKIQKKLCSNKNGASNGSPYASKIKEVKLPSCVLTGEHLKSDKFPIRTLTVMGGLFYAGQLSAIRAPDVYGITIDGERGNRPHIYSREEILRDSILEVKLEKTVHLPPGTRCCAYWSEQYRCLYPGTVSMPASPNPELDEKFVNVEFDDGDSGRINIDDIRLLPEDYPVVEYDPNPLQSLTKRRRRISGTSIESHSKERKSIDSLPNIENESDKTSEESDSINEESESKKIIHICESSTFLSLESERKHLKKKRREKLKRLQSLSIDGKKKHKKHRCSDEHRHHRHHKKHRKHKHKHGKRHCVEINGVLKPREEVKVEEVLLSKDKSEKRMKKKAKNKCKSVENSCKMSDSSKVIKPKKCKERTESVESRSKMAAFLPARQLWGWSGKGYKRPGAKGRARKEFYKTIQRGKERITVGDCAVFLSTGRPDRPYIGRIESMWESWGTNMIVKVKWFYHPEETVGCPSTLEYPGALFESPHVDENDVQTISHKCEVLPLKDYTAKIGNSPHRYETIYDNNDIYYLAGYYDPTNTTLRMEPGVK